MCGEPANAARRHMRNSLTFMAPKRAREQRGHDNPRLRESHSHADIGSQPVPCPGNTRGGWCGHARRHCLTREHNPLSLVSSFASAATTRIEPDVRGGRLLGFLCPPCTAGTDTTARRGLCQLWQFTAEGRSERRLSLFLCFRGWRDDENASGTRTNTASYREGVPDRTATSLLSVLSGRSWRVYRKFGFAATSCRTHTF